MACVHLSRSQVRRVVKALGFRTPQNCHNIRTASMGGKVMAKVQKYHIHRRKAQDRGKVQSHAHPVFRLEEVKRQHKPKSNPNAQKPAGGGRRHEGPCEGRRLEGPIESRSCCFGQQQDRHFLNLPPVCPSGDLIFSCRPQRRLGDMQARNQVQKAGLSGSSPSGDYRARQFKCVTNLSATNGDDGECAGESLIHPAFLNRGFRAIGHRRSPRNVGISECMEAHAIVHLVELVTVRLRFILSQVAACRDVRMDSRCRRSTRFRSFYE